MKRRMFLFLILVVAIVALYGCGKSCPDTCDDSNSCTEDVCGEATEYLCKHNKIAGCTCGDKYCDAKIENKCTCPKDCGICPAPEQDYLVAVCIEENKNGRECSRALNESKVEEKTISKNFETSDFILQMEYVSKKPFDIKNDIFSFDFKIVEKYEEFLFPLEFTQIEVKKGSELMGKSDLSKDAIKISSFDDVAKVSIKLDKYVMKLIEEEEYPEFTVYYKYGKNKVVSYDADNKPVYEAQETRANRQFTLDGATLFVNPYFGLPKEAELVKNACPLSCSDNNACTIDTCDASTGFKCVNKIIPNCKCGDGFCDPDTENRCSCSQDCGSCPTYPSNYVSSSCDVEKSYLSECGWSMNQKSVTTRPFSQDVGFPNSKVKIEYNFKRPFDVNKDRFSWTLTLMETRGNFAPSITFNSIELKRGTLLLGRAEIKAGEKKLSKSGDKVQLEIYLNKYKLTEVQETFDPTIWFYYSYSYYEKVDGADVLRTENDIYSDGFAESVIAIDTTIKPK